MSILIMGMWLAGIVAFLFGMVAFLPDASTYPYPADISTAFHTIFSWTYSLNSIFPVDTLLTILKYSLVLWFIVKVVWPSLIWVFESITGTGR
jgi:hypothetical protein